MELPFAVESPERTSQLMGDAGDDGSSLVTTSSQGSFLGSSTGTGGAFSLPSHQYHQQQQSLHAAINTTHRPHQTQQHHPQQLHHHHHHPVSSYGGTTQHHHEQHRPSPMVSPLPAAPVPAPSTTAATITNLFGNLRVPGMLTSSKQPKAAVHSSPGSHASRQQQVETIDFTTYEYVCETDADEVDIILDPGQHSAAIMEGLQGTLGIENAENQLPARGDVLTILLSGAANEENSTNEGLVRRCEEANEAANQAMEAKSKGGLQEALEAHARAAKQFREAAVLIKDTNASLANSLLLLSQTQAKSAIALKRIVKEHPVVNHCNNDDESNNPRRRIMTQKDRLRAAVRGALVTRNEEEMSDSAFLGKATKGPVSSSSTAKSEEGKEESSSTSTQASNSPSKAANEPRQHNPVDDMMELERELRDMDMALELGNSIASLDARTQSRLKSSIGVDGSFMVVPPGSQSYMSSSNMWSPSSGPCHPTSGGSNPRHGPNPSNKQNPRARNRVQNILEASAVNHPRSTSHPLPGATKEQHQHPNQQQHSKPPVAGPLQTPAGLESSWWGTSSATSQVLTSSVISLGASSFRGGIVSDGAADHNSAANTKQLMRLMDALKTLGDENANLLREVEEAEAARLEAKAAREQMARFKEDYGKKFKSLKAALDKFIKEHGHVGSTSNEPNPVTNSEYMRNASTSEQLQRQEQLIRKLTADLKKEKEESKKKDLALQKYESFYREVKARSAQKAAQRKKDEAAGHTAPPRPSHSKSGSRKSGHR